MLGELRFTGKSRSINSCAPWRSVDAVAEVKAKMTKTPQSQIDKCLQCKAPACWNCMACKGSAD